MIPKCQVARFYLNLIEIFYYEEEIEYLVVRRPGFVKPKPYITNLSGPERRNITYNRKLRDKTMRLIKAMFILFI